VEFVEQSLWSSSKHPLNGVVCSTPFELESTASAKKVASPYLSVRERGPSQNAPPPAGET
jgi:hypothetical protein